MRRAEPQPMPLSVAQLRDLELLAEGAEIVGHGVITRLPPAQNVRTGEELVKRRYAVRAGTKELRVNVRSKARPRTVYLPTLLGIVRYRAERSHRRHCAGCKLCLAHTRKRVA